MEHSDPPIMAWNAILLSSRFGCEVWKRGKERVEESVSKNPSRSLFGPVERGSQANSTRFDLKQIRLQKKLSFSPSLFQTTMSEKVNLSLSIPT